MVLLFIYWVVNRSVVELESVESRHEVFVEFRCISFGANEK